MGRGDDRGLLLGLMAILPLLCEGGEVVGCHKLAHKPPQILQLRPCLLFLALLGKHLALYFLLLQGERLEALDLPGALT